MILLKVYFIPTVTLNISNLAVVFSYRPSLDLACAKSVSPASGETWMRCAFLKSLRLPERQPALAGRRGPLQSVTSYNAQHKVNVITVKKNHHHVAVRLSNRNKTHMLQAQ